MMSKEGKFVVKKITKFSDLKEGLEVEMPESDLCLQNQESIIQMAYVEPDKDSSKAEIKPGVFMFTETPEGIRLTDLELRKRDKMLESINNTSKILNEARTFFSRLHIYDMLDRPKKRAVLLYSKPGMGKTSSIERFCFESMKEDPGTVVMVWPTSKIDPDSVHRFLASRSKYVDGCSRVILIMEDIGGSEGESRHRRDDVDSSLLNLLDGVGLTFKLPTFIIATTNFPENLLQSLADRPGRFDLMMELNPPSYEEKVALLEFISKRDLNPEEKLALKTKGAEDMSIAHLEEIIVRSLLHDKSMTDVINEMIEHTRKFKNSFEEKRRLGMGFSEL